MSSTDSRKMALRIGHSPDPDDAFMWYPLANNPALKGPDGLPLRPRIDTRRFDFLHILEDIQSLNERAENAELEITALSIAQYPYVADKYALTNCGSSMGDNYGPMVVATAPMQWHELRHATPIAVPGERTTAFLALSLALGKDSFDYEVLPFDQIIPALQEGDFHAGLIIHEGQLTYAKDGLHSVLDLGQWWNQRTGLPLPLGGNAIRRDLGQQTMDEVCAVLLESIRYALSHRDDCLSYAMGFGRGLDKQLADRFVSMYVNHWTLDYGEIGRRAVRTLIREAIGARLVPDCGEVDFVGVP
jgi:1,4-dihydroxy-6-naphthoate synthase